MNPIIVTDDKATRWLFLEDGRTVALYFEDRDIEDRTHWKYKEHIEGPLAKALIALLREYRRRQEPL